MTQVQFFVQGLPVTQGSKNVYTNKKTGKPILTESRHAELQRWRTLIALRWKQQQAAKLTGAIAAQLDYYMPRPKSHFGTGRNAHKLKPSAPYYCAVKPDVDKLDRAVFDALTQAGAIEDDARIVIINAVKMYANKPAQQGVNITLAQVPDKPYENKPPTQRPKEHAL